MVQAHDEPAAKPIPAPGELDRPYWEGRARGC